MNRLFHLIIILQIGLTSNYSQGISIGGAADIEIDAVDGDRFPTRQLIEFNLGEVEGAFTLEINAYFEDSDEIPYISRFQDLLTLCRTSSPTNLDYRHINDDEVLRVTIQDIQGKTIYSKNETIFSGENRFKIQSLDLRGVYFLTLVTKENSITRKVIFL